MKYSSEISFNTFPSFKKQYKRAINYVSLRPIVTITKEDVQEEILKVLLGKMKHEDMNRISENLGIPTTQIQSIIRLIQKTKRAR